MRHPSSAPGFTTATSRRVRRLCLHASSDEDVRRGAVLIEDALRTASMPEDEDGRMLIIRRLPLGRIDRYAGPATVALQIAVAVRKAAEGAVSFDDTTAIAADVVTFSSRASAIIALACRHARHEPADAWYWSDVVRGWHSGADRSRKWRDLIEAAFDVPEASIVQGAIVQGAIEAGAVEDLLSALSPRDARGYLAASGWSDVYPSDPIPGANARGPAAATVGRFTVDLPGDERSIWLLTMEAVHHRPSRAADPRLPGTMRSRLARQWPGAEEGSVGRDASPARIRNPARDADEPVTAPLQLGEGRRQGVPDRRAVQDASGARTGQSESPGPSLIGELHAPATRFPDGKVDVGRRDDAPASWAAGPTTAGGLLLLVAILERLGMATWVEQEPELLEAGFPARLLRHIGEAVGVDLDDPLLRVLRDLHRGAPPPPVVAPPAPVLALAASFTDRITGDAPYAAWHAAAAAWCLRRAHVPLATLVCRSGRLTSSPTHVRITFRLSQLDVRVRRLALDVDPGWVPWLGRVIQFHYRDAHEPSS